MTTIRRAFVIFAACTALAVPFFAFAQAWPSKPVRIIVPAPAAWNIKRGDIIYRHTWREKYVVVGDNLALQHARETFDSKYKRICNGCRSAMALEKDDMKISIARRRLTIAGAATASLGLAGRLQAQLYPSREIHLILPLTAGSLVDTLARAFSPEMEKQLKQPIVVENRPGAETIIATQLVQRAERDGYTLGLVIPQFAMNVHAYPGVLPASTNSIICWRNAAGYGSLVLLMVDSSHLNFEVSTKRGQLQLQSLLRVVRCLPARRDIATHGAV